MNILEVPFLSELIFTASTLVFLFTIYAVIPGFIYEKRTLYNINLINSLWVKIINELLFWFIKLFKYSPKAKLVKVAIRNEQLK